jgi:lipid-A-disaccharide synthase
MTSGDDGMRERAYSAAGQDLRLFMIAGEHSGDALGAKLMAALNERRRGRIRYLGVGGAQMAQQGWSRSFRWRMWR